MRRRDVLKLMASSPLWLTTYPALTQSNPRWDRILIIVELKGGNDSLNTFIPYSDPLYYQYRPQLAIPHDKVLPLGDQIALHPAMQPLLPLWEEKQLALIHGLGYAQPNLSHFRSIEIWNTGSDSQTVLQDGWITRTLYRNPLPHTFTANGIALTEDTGPLDGVHSRSIVMRNPRQFLKRAQQLEIHEAPTDNPALAHVLEVQKSIKEASSSMLEKLLDENFLSQSPFKSNIDAQFSVVAHLLEHDIANPVYKLTHGNFDTHSNQLGQHQRLLGQLAEAIVNFRTQLQKSKLWDKVAIVTYSEFSRRIQENGSLGTDHGTTASHMLIGGQVKGGHYGVVPKLDDLEDGHLKFTTDFRQLYSTLIDKWWNIAPAQNLFAQFPVLPVFDGPVEGSTQPA